MVFTTEKHQIDFRIRWFAQLFAITMLTFASGSLYAENQTIQKLAPDTLTTLVAQYLNINSEVSFRDITPSHTSDDIRHLQQIYNGIDIDQAVIAVRLTNDGKIKRIYGEVVQGLPPQPQPMASFRSSQTIEFDYRDVAQHFLRQQEPSGEWLIRDWVEKPIITRRNNVLTQVMSATFIAENHASERYLRIRLLIDTNTQAIVDVQNLIRYSLQAGSGLGGNVMAGQKNYAWVNNATDALTANTFLITRENTQCKMQISPTGDQWTNNVIVIKGKDATDAYGYECTAQNGNNDNLGQHDEDLSATLQAHSPINDAAYHAQVAFNLYERFAITRELGPLKEKGRPLIVRVNYTSNNFPSDNAFWNGEFIALGDGLVNFYPKVSADTLGHELAHAVLEKYSLINQNGGIPLGISESFGDIAGEATEYAIAQKNQNTNDWKYAADTFKPTLEDAARYFASPSLDGNSIESPKQYNSEVKGHYLAGPFNKAFYHLIHDNLADGWNPIIGYDLWLTAAANCWVPGIQYEAAAQCVVDSATPFRAKNTELPPSVDAKDIRFALIHAFAQADIMTQTDQELVALFDYQRSFDDIVLINKTSLPNNSATTFQWDVDNDGSIDALSTDLDMVQVFQVDPAQSTFDIKLAVQQGNIEASYLRRVDLAPLYCTPSGNGQSQDYIKQVNLNGQSFAESSSEEDGYGDYTDLPPTTLDVNGKNIFTLTPNDNSVARYWAVYVDFNGDHDFTDEGEKIIDNIRTFGDLTDVVDLNLGTEHAGKFTRMRVVLNWSINLRSCGNASSGEHEDYRVLLSDIPDPQTAFTYQTTEDSLAIKFTNISEQITSGATWSWRYQYPNDLSFTEFSTQEHADFIFPQSGPVTIALALMTSTGDEYVTEQALQIPTVNGEPLLDFEIELIKDSPKVIFINQTTEYADDATWQWDYGDGKSATHDSFIERHSHKYNTDKISDDVKELTITLVVSQNGESYQIQKTFSRQELPEAGAFLWGMPLVIWLLLVRIVTPTYRYRSDGVACISRKVWTHKLPIQ